MKGKRTLVRLAGGAVLAGALAMFSAGIAISDDYTQEEIESVVSPAAEASDIQAYLSASSQNDKDDAVARALGYSDAADYFGSTSGQFADPGHPPF